MLVCVSKKIQYRQFLKRYALGGLFSIYRAIYPGMSRGLFGKH